MSQPTPLAQTPTGIKQKGVSSFILKLIAIFGMTTDHIGVVFRAYLPPPVTAALYAFGGLTFPIMAYLLTVGYRHTRDIKKYALRLLGFACISFIPFSVAFGRWYFNVMFTLLLGLIAIYAYDHMQNRFLFRVLFALLIFLNMYCDWAPIGVIMVFLFHRIEHPRARILVPMLFPWLLCAATIPSIAPGMLIYSLPDLLFIFVGCTLAVPLLLRYNGERGRDMKFFFYWYYPLHLSVLCVIRYFMFGVLMP
ncbi:conjugal transfer protein TraX [Ruminococcaceae bacterium OttesenSCG-928-N02]|nr:conjugal transfer protein TraX [Ruminococcaceae bacterium OttesenSCG-928-N02]